MAGPFVAERKSQTPWHAHHIAERYGLLVIITLGEVIIGTVASINAVVHGEAGWTVDAALLALAGVGLTFGSWWVYFAVPWAEPLVRHRERAFTFGYGHLFIFASLAAMGGGPARRRVRAGGRGGDRAGRASCSASRSRSPSTSGVFYVLYSLLMRTHDPFHLALVAPRPACSCSRSCSPRPV